MLLTRTHTQERGHLWNKSPQAQDVTEVGCLGSNGCDGNLVAAHGCNLQAATGIGTETNLNTLS